MGVFPHDPGAFMRKGAYGYPPSCLKLTPMRSMSQIPLQQRQTCVHQKNIKYNQILWGKMLVRRPPKYP